MNSILPTHKICVNRLQDRTKSKSASWKLFFTFTVKMIKHAQTKNLNVLLANFVWLFTQAL